MPIYEYKHLPQDEEPSCEGRVEKLRRFSQMDEPVACPLCDEPLTRCISQSNFSLKGGGWAKDGYG